MQLQFFVSNVPKEEADERKGRLAKRLTGAFGLYSFCLHLQTFCEGLLEERNTNHQWSWVMDQRPLESPTLPISRNWKACLHGIEKNFYLQIFIEQCLLF
jgi:hypothetical protein